MRFGQALSEITIPEWKQCYLNYEILKIFVTIIKVLVQQIQKCDQAIGKVENERDQLGQQQQIVVPVTVGQLRTVRKELSDHLAATNKQFYRIFFIQIEITQLFYQMKVLEIDDRYRVISKLKNKNFRQQKLQLYLTYIEYAYIQISYLKEMRQSNLEAQRKILKKHVKYAKKMTPTPSPNHDKITRMIKIQEDYTNKIQNDYVEHNRHLQSKVARQFLRKAAHKEDTSQTQYFFMGFGVGASIIVLGTLIFIILYQGLNVQNTSIFSRDFPTWRGIAIFILYIWVLGFDLYLFQKYKISHRLIFKFNDHHYSTSAEIFKLAGIFTTAFLAIFMVYLLNITKVFTSSAFSQQYYVLIIYGMLFVYLLIPLPIMNHIGRLYALRLILNCLISPITGVTFSIVWMTDQWISLTTPLRDLAYTICYYTKIDFNSSSKANPCTQSKTVEVALIVIVIVFSYRILQCMRLGLTDGFFCTDHMFNTLKYLVSLTSSLLAYFYKIDPSLLSIWIVVSIISTLYSYYWDLKKDWCLLQPGSRNFLLRKYLTFQPKRNYYIIIVLNFIMRLSWTITLSPGIVSLFGDPNLVTFATGAVQIIRRGIWSLLRVQREHLANCVEFKAIPDMTHIQDKLEEGMIVPEGVLDVRNKEHVKNRQIVKKQFIQLIKQKITDREEQEKQFTSEYEEINVAKAKKAGKKIKQIMIKLKKHQ